MKLDFTYYNPTKIYFGRTALDNLAGELANYSAYVPSFVCNAAS